MNGLLIWKNVCHIDFGMNPKIVRAWIEAMRLRTLPVSVAGVLAGCGCALQQGAFRWAPAVICLLFGVGAQIVSNFANEYYDYHNGLDRKGREGFRRGVTEGDISPRAMKRATFGLLAVVCLLGCSLIYWGGWWLIAVGVAVAVFAIAYSGGPWPLSSHGLGDVAVVIFFGIVPVSLTAWLQAHNAQVWGAGITVGVAFGVMIANVLIVNNYRDADDDRAVGKRTTVVMFGRKAMAWVYLLNGFVAVLLLLFESPAYYLPYTMAPFMYLVMHIVNWRELRRSQGRELNKVLGKTAMTVLVTAVLFVITCAVWPEPVN